MAVGPQGAARRSATTFRPAARCAPCRRSRSRQRSTAWQSAALCPRQWSAAARGSRRAQYFQGGVAKLGPSEGAEARHRPFCCIAIIFKFEDTHGHSYSVSSPFRVTLTVPNNTDQPHRDRFDLQTRCFYDASLSAIFGRRSDRTKTHAVSAFRPKWPHFFAASLIPRTAPPSAAEECLQPVFSSMQHRAGSK